MAPRLRRPEVNASINICSRTLVGDQSVAVQVANQQQLQLARAKSAETIPAWSEELELEVLTGFGIDPKRYTLGIHDLTPSNQPCPEEQEIKTLKDVNINQIVTGPYEVHFVLRDNVAAPTVEELRKWQQKWAEAVAEPSPAPPKHMVTLCNSRNHVATLAVGDLKTPPEGDVEKTLRLGLGLTSPQDMLKYQLGKALRLELEGREVKFHLNGEECTDLRDIDELTTIALAPSNVVKLHLPSALDLEAGTEAETEDEESDEE